MRRLIKKYQTLFVGNDGRLGSANIEQHRIWTKDDIPVSQPYRRIAKPEVGAVKEQIDNWCNRGIAVKSNGGYASPLVVVKKSNGELRLCVDYRKLNEKTIRDAYPISRVAVSPSYCIHDITSIILETLPIPNRTQAPVR